MDSFLRSARLSGASSTDDSSIFSSLRQAALRISYLGDLKSPNFVLELLHSYNRRAVSTDVSSHRLVSGIRSI
jgi:hypothetical protein